MLIFKGMSSLCCQTNKDQTVKNVKMEGKKKQSCHSEVPKTVCYKMTTWNPIMVPKYNWQHSCYYQKKQMSLYCLSFESIGHSAGLFIQLYISPIRTWLSMSDQDHRTLTCPTKPLLKIITHSSEAGAKRSQPKVENIHGVTVRLFAPVVSQNGVQEQNSSLSVCHSQTVAKLGFWSICAHMVSQYLPLTALVNGLTEKNWS